MRWIPLAVEFTSSGIRLRRSRRLGTSTEHGILTLAQLYRDRADVENNFDELKNQWGWGGFTTQDLARCRLMARMVALIYNWWTLFVRLAQPHKHFEAISSRPLLLHGVATQTQHTVQKRLTLTSTHAKQSGTDQPRGVPELTESHCGAVDGCATTAGNSVSSIREIYARNRRCADTINPSIWNQLTALLLFLGLTKVN